MTSKMHQRVKDREKGKKSSSDNGLWDSAEQHFVNSVVAIDQAQGLIASVLEEIVKDPEKFKLIKDPETLNENVNLLNKDIQRHSDLLNGIHEKHQGRTGPAKTQDDYMSVLQVNCEYAEAMEVYEANIQPTMHHILELIGVSDEIVQNQQAAGELPDQPYVDPALVDPTVVSDITFKEV